MRSVTARHVTSFGQDDKGRLYATGDGKVFLVIPSGPRP
jgi:hypothetical protein